MLRGGRGGGRGTHKQDGALPRVQHSQPLVLAGGEDPGSVPVPAHAVDHVCVHAVDPHHGLAAGHVPNDHHVIAAWRGGGHTVTQVRQANILLYFFCDQ